MLAKGTRQTEIAKHSTYRKTKFTKPLRPFYELCAGRDGQAIAIAGGLERFVISKDGKAVYKMWAERDAQAIAIAKSSEREPLARTLSHFTSKMNAV
jgi:hypothetical protein